MTDRELAVLTVLRESFPCGPASIARLLNWYAVCDWCPVLRPRRSEKCAYVPRKSSAAVWRVLQSLVEQGAVECARHRRGQSSYFAVGATRADLKSYGLPWWGRA